MIFDKNQKEFPSKEHNAIWNLGIHVLPIDITLPFEIQNSISSSLVESCEQMHKFILHLLSDMYENIQLYLPLPYQLSRKILVPFIELSLLGETDDDSLTINRLVFDKYIKKLKNSIDYEDDKKLGISIEYRLNNLKRVGLKFDYNSNNVILSNTFYPNMFYAMREMAIITSNEKASMDNSFTYCDFRKLCKDYKYDKYKNALVFLNDEQKNLAEQLDTIAKKLKLTRSIKSGHCAGFEIEYNYKKVNILNLNCLCSYYENSLSDNSNNYKNNIIILQIRLLYNVKNLEPINNFFNAIENDSEDVKNFVYKRLGRCRACYDKCPRYGGHPLLIYGKPNKICLRADFSLKSQLIIIGSAKKLMTFTTNDLSLLEKTLTHVKILTDESLLLK